MSQENVEIVRTGVEAFNAGDWDRYFDQLDPDVEWWDRGDEPTRPCIAGTRVSAHFWLTLLRRWRLGCKRRSSSTPPSGWLSPFRLHGHGKTSGAEFEEHEVHALRLRDGKIVEVREYRTKEQALEAVGLRE